MERSPDSIGSVGLNRLFGPSITASVRRDGDLLIREVEVSGRHTTTVLELTDRSSPLDDDLTSAWFLERVAARPLLMCLTAQILRWLVDLFCAPADLPRAFSDCGRAR